MTRTSERAERRLRSDAALRRLAGPFGIPGRVDGYADKDKRDDNQQRCDNDLHSYIELAGLKAVS